MSKKPQILVVGDEPAVMITVENGLIHSMLRNSDVSLYEFKNPDDFVTWLEGTEFPIVIVTNGASKNSVANILEHVMVHVPKTTLVVALIDSVADIEGNIDEYPQGRVLPITKPFGVDILV